MFFTHMFLKSLHFYTKIYNVQNSTRLEATIIAHLITRAHNPITLRSKLSEFGSVPIEVFHHPSEHYITRAQYP